MGELGQEYRVHVLLRPMEYSTMIQVRIGVDYDAETGSGVDVLEFQSCATTTTPIGDWPEPGSELVMTYASCQGLVPNDLIVLGSFRVIAETPGSFSLRLVNFGGTGTVPRFVTCDLEERLIHPQNVGQIALGSQGGFDPCSGFIDTFAGACCLPDSCVSGDNLACCWANGGKYMGAFTSCTSCVTDQVPKTWGQLKS